MIDLAPHAGDWTISEHLVLVTPVAKQVVDANPRRYSLLFAMSAPGGGPPPFSDIIFVSTDPLVGGIGMTVLIGNMLRLDYPHVAVLTQKPLFAKLVGGLAVANLSVIEVIQSANLEK